MSLYNITVVNNAPGCNNQIDQQLNVTGCTTYIIRVSQSSNALGPFSIYVDSVLFGSGYTRTEMLNGVPIQLGPCVSPTPTPTLTPTPTGTPGASPTPTPSITPTNTATPTVTPTITVTPSITPTNTVTPTPSTTPGASPTPTPSITPTFTVTPTITQTQTLTPTPTPTPQTFEIYIMDQLGNIIQTQNGDLLILEGPVYTYTVSSGDTSSVCIAGAGSYSLTQTLYSPSNDWYGVVRFFQDGGLNIPFNGGDLYYTNSNDGCGGFWKISSDGFTTDSCNPC